MKKYGFGYSIISKRTAIAGGVSPSIVLNPVASVPYAVAGQTLSCTEGSWSGTEPITKTFQLQSSSNGVSGWSNVTGATSSTYIIPNSAAQLLFYRWAVTGNNGIGAPVVAYSNVIGGVDSEANTHYNRVIADSGVLTYGLIGVDTYLKSIKYIYNISALSTKFVALRQLDYLGYKIGSGSGVTTGGRAVQTVYSALGAVGDYVQNTTTVQPALAAWSVGENYLSTFDGVTNGCWSSAKANPNNSKITIIVRFRKASNINSPLCSHGDGSINWLLQTSSSIHQPSLSLADGSTHFATASLGANFNGYLRLIVTTSGSDLLLNYSSSSDGVTYTALGAQVTAAGKSGQIGSASRSFRIGARSNFHNGISAEYLMAQVYDANDTLLFNFNPNSYNRSVNQTSWTASTGETYTLSTATATTGLKAMIVDQTMIQGNGTTMGMQAASLSINTLQFTEYNVWRKFLNSAVSGSTGILKEFGSNVASSHGYASAPNEAPNTESIYTSSNGGLNGTSWQNTSTLLKVNTFEGNILGVPYEQNLLTNNVQTPFNAIQSSGGNTTAIVATGQNLLARNNATGLWLNAIWIADALTVTTDTSGEKAGIYNLLADYSNII